MNLSQAKSTPKQLNLNKLSDAGGSQIHWPATLAKTDSSSNFGIMGLFHRTLPHLVSTFRRFWHVHRCFQLLNVSKSPGNCRATCNNSP